MGSDIGKNKLELDTPCLVIDKNKLIHNIKQMQKFADSKGKQVRPHAKTHKCSEICKLQLKYGAIGICVTKISEAYELAKSSIKNILITSPVVTDTKIDKLVKVMKLAPRTMLVVDSLENAKKLNKTFLNLGIKLDVLIDIDAGIGRTGIEMSEAMNLALKINQLSNLNFKGIQCYSGHIQHIENIEERKLASNKILIAAGQVKQKLINVGLECNIQTGSGTGTFSIDADLPNVTEIQPGSYTVMDAEYNNIDYQNKKFLAAMTMLTTVISANQSSHVTVDAGTKALYQVSTRPQIISQDNLKYDWDYFGDEHGKVTSGNNKLPKLNDVLELVVAHCDPTINLFDYFYITENDIVVDIWKINLRGCCQ
ncbi:MAG: D-serine deaminase-like pyridoxal phosphate-dependent protein [Francisellaceae bacterium]|jgi:D-serine deaminase-like pyridoxal phosphate-dependent protein